MQAETSKTTETTRPTRIRQTPWPCDECGRLTVGSVGPTGIVWLSVCQVCKDKADQQAEETAVGMVTLLEHAATSIMIQPQAAGGDR